MCERRASVIGMCLRAVLVLLAGMKRRGDADVYGHIDAVFDNTLKSCRT